MDFFLHTEKNNKKNLKTVFVDFRCGIVSIHDKKFVHDVENKLGKNIHFNLHKCEKF
jgi:hypothetical protein